MSRFKSYSKRPMWFIALLLTALVAGCGGGDNNPSPGVPSSGDVVAPTVTSTVPANAATGVPINRKITASFSEAMDAATITAATFTVTDGTTPVSGAVTYLGTTATFTPASNLAPSTPFTATITTGAKDLAGNALAAPFVWNFTTGTAVAAALAPVDLLTVRDNNFVILTKTGITNTGSNASVITGNIGASPITAAAMNGVFCSEITGTIFGVDAAYTGSGAVTCFAGNPPASNKTLVDNAVLDMGTAYNDAEGRTLPDATELGAGDISGLTIVPGLYKWASGLLIASDVTLSGSANDVWIFQIAQNLTVSNGVTVLLSGGAQAKNIFWQVGGGTGVAIGTTAHIEGTVLAIKAITLATGAVANSRLLAQTAVTLDATTVTQPAP